MFLLPEYTRLIRSRNVRLKWREIVYPEETYEESLRIVVAEEQKELAREIPPYLSDTRGRMNGESPVYPELLNGVMYFRSGAPAYSLLFLDVDGLHRIVCFSP